MDSLILDTNQQTVDDVAKCKSFFDKVLLKRVNDVHIKASMSTQLLSPPLRSERIKNKQNNSSFKKEEEVEDTTLLSPAKKARTTVVEPTSKRTDTILMVNAAGEHACPSWWDEHDTIRNDVFFCEDIMALSENGEHTSLSLCWRFVCKRYKNEIRYGMVMRFQNPYFQVL